MIAPLAKFIDWSVLQIGGAMLPWREPINERDLKLEQAIQFLDGPDFIPAESQPAQLDFVPDASGGRFRFPTPRPCEFAENNVVHGRLYRCANAWQERPLIVGLHGGGDFPRNQFGFHLFARRCLRAGFNAATLELPYHFQRRPRQYGPLNILCQYSSLISRDYLQMAKTYAQAVAEIRSLSGWLLAEGCPAVALVGVSLGAYLAKDFNTMDEQLENRLRFLRKANTEGMPHSDRGLFDLAWHPAVVSGVLASTIGMATVASVKRLPRSGRYIRTPGQLG